MDITKYLTTESLLTAAAELSAGIVGCEAVIAEEQRKLGLLREEHHLVRRLLELRTDVTKDEDAPNAPIVIGPPALEASIEELTKAGRPLHISELFRTLQQRGVSIPGSGQQANLISLLTRDDRIYRPERGFYALSQWQAEKSPATSRGRRVHVRVRKLGNESND